MEAKHTLGPWVLNTTKVEGAIVRWHIAGQKHGSVYPICEHVIEVEPDATEQFHNARLIAAAPELLDALVYVKQFEASRGGSWAELKQVIDAAITKATGA